MAIDPNALASALPAGITYILGSGRDDWTAAKIAEFQAERLAESGYRLIRPFDDETVERVAWGLCPSEPPCNDHRNDAREALEALTEVQ